MRPHAFSAVLTLLTALFAAGCGGNPSEPDDLRPVVQSISPNFGPITGGSAITVHGLNFTGPITLTIGGQAATDVAVPSADVITAKVPAAAGAGPADVVVSSGTGTGTLTGGFNYLAPPDNSPPSITAIVIQGNRPNEPPDFADLNEAISISAQVNDPETASDQMRYEWTAAVGSFSGEGQTVTWQAPATAETPLPVAIEVRVVERYGQDGIFEHVVTATRILSLHDSAREVGDMARRFLTEFSKPQSNQDWRDIMKDFDLAGGTCLRPSAIEEEKQQVITHYTNFVMHEYEIGPATVSVNFGSICAVRARPGDACVGVPVYWDSTDTRTNKRAQTTGVDRLSAAYAEHAARWWLCSSDLVGSSLGHSIYGR
jgi:hypothetical protein